MSKLIVLLFAIACMAVVQASPAAKPCGPGGYNYPSPPRYRYPPPQQQQQPTAPPPTAAPPAGALAPLTPAEQAELNYLYARYEANPPATA